MSLLAHARVHASRLTEAYKKQLSYKFLNRPGTSCLSNADQIIQRNIEQLRAREEEKRRVDTRMGEKRHSTSNSPPSFNQLMIHPIEENQSFTKSQQLELSHQVEEPYAGVPSMKNAPSSDAGFSTIENVVEAK